MKKTFSAELLAGHKDAALEVPFDPSEVWRAEAKSLWKGRRGYEVTAIVNGVSFESCIVPRQKKFFMLVSADVIKEIGIAIGDTVKAAVEFIAD
jgi:hypothetical protein